MIDKHFFKKYQRQLLWIANTSLGRRYFRISNDIPKDKRIAEFRPNSFTWIEKIERIGDEYKITKKTDFRTHAKFAKRINYSLSKINFFFRTWKIPFKTENGWVTFPIFVIAPLTTSTFYPDADVESTSVDGYTNGFSPTSFADVRSIAGSGSNDVNTIIIVRSDEQSASSFIIYRSPVLLDTSSIADTDSIDSGTMSFYATLNDDNGSDSVALTTCTPASNTALVNSDYNIANWSDIQQATAIDQTSLTLNDYNTFTLNATGLSNISKTGITKFGIRLLKDVTNTAPTAGSFIRAYFSSADVEGTAQDPKLVVTHTAVVVVTVSSTLLLMGV